MIKVQDLPLSLKNYGFYYYDKQFWTIKQDALDHAISNNDFDPDIRFVFHDDVFGKIDWSVEPEPSLKELYKQRAQQLRDTYDYLILQYSGGVDSDNVLKTFLTENIFIDEIQTYQPLKIIEKLEPVDDRDHRLAGIFEFRFTTLPGLMNSHLKTKISIIDTSDYLMGNWNENFLADHGVHLRFNNSLFNNLRVLQTVEVVNSLKKKNIGVIYGAEKPKPSITNNKLYFGFIDGGRSGHQAQIYQQHGLFTPEMFYWSPNFPSIPIKQMHLIKKELETNKTLYDEIVKNNFKLSIEGIRTVLDTLINRIIYPHWKETTFQSNIKDRNDIIMDIAGFDSGKIIQLKNDNVLNKYGKISTRVGIRKLSYGIGSVTPSRRYIIGKLRHEQCS